jgi:hypothetical protein
LEIEMKIKDLSPDVSPENSLPAAGEPADAAQQRVMKRRSFLKNVGMAGAALSAGSLLSSTAKAAIGSKSAKPSSGDIAILQFVAAAELLETDLWLQYGELGGNSTAPPNNYQLALQQLDGDAQQYITSNTSDESTHARFLNAYLVSIGAAPVNLDKFRTLPSSQATGARQIGRLTNIMQLSVPTSWYIRYRSTDNPDFGATFLDALPQLTNGQFTAIPRNDADFGPTDHIQAIANTAAFHFASIEQGGTSLYAALAQKATSPEVLQIMLSIGGDEIAHFLEWMDFAGNAVQPPVAPLTDSTNGLHFPDFVATGGLLRQPNLIFPVPCEFISPSLPKCAVIRPTTDAEGGALAAVAGLTASNLFLGQPQSFFDLLNMYATRADAAQRM